MNAVRLTIGITTRDRPAALERCLRSISVLAHLSPEVLIFDDASAVPVSDSVAAWDLPMPVRVLRDDRAPGYIAGRNRLVREASAAVALLMDDDAAFLSAEGVEHAVRLLETDRVLGAIAFAQCDRHGTRWDDGMQPARSRVACYVPSFIGFAHLLRRDVFMDVGGYRESFEFYGEEKDYCLRLIASGYRTLYLPDALVIHEPDQIGRSQQRYLRYVTRNDCLTALYNEPFVRLDVAAPGAPGTVLPHASRVERRRPVGLGVDSARAGDERGIGASRPKTRVARNGRDVEATATRTGKVRAESLKSDV